MRIGNGNCTVPIGRDYILLLLPTYIYTILTTRKYVLPLLMPNAMELNIIIKPTSPKRFLTGSPWQNIIFSFAVFSLVSCSSVPSVSRVPFDRYEGQGVFSPFAFSLNDSSLKPSLPSLHQKDELEGKNYLNTLVIPVSFDGGSLGISISGNSVIVSDTAIGIPEDALPRILSVFYCVSNSRGKQAIEGSRLGLAIVKHIVSSMTIPSKSIPP
jgi:hypothetical protein